MTQPPHARARARVSGPSRSFRARIWLSQSLWVPVLVPNVVAVACGLLLPRIDRHIDHEHLPIPVSAAQAIFGSLAGGMITFTGIVFSAVFVAAQIETASYSPRLAARLRRDPVVLAGLAFPTATAVYSLLALAAVGRQNALGRGADYVPAVTVIFGLALAGVTLAVFVALVQRAFDRIQIGGILRSLMSQARTVLDDVHPLHPAEGDARPAPPVLDGPVTEVRHEGAPAVLSAVDRGALVRLSESTGAFVEVLPLVGEYLMTGTPILRLHGAEGDPRSRDAERVLVMARQRTIDQDPAFVLRMLVDIAIRGLSPAVNDPTTAAQALDRIEAMLIDVLARHPGLSYVVGPAGRIHGSVPAPTSAQYVELGLVEIRHYGRGSIQIARRMRATHDRLRALAPPDALAVIEREARLLEAHVAGDFPDAEEAATAALQDRLGLGGRPRG
ncbi:MAG TPA: DUF2254 domain-containing protein [Thermoleophilaceae bacterium]|nr:DUF2254 domain-containing protein [Thermoleophilaceae bacterium]